MTQTLITMVDKMEHNQSPITVAWRRIETLLDHMHKEFEALEPKRELIGSEIFASLREQHNALWFELVTLRAAYAKPVPGALAFRDRASRVSTNFAKQIRDTYDWLRTTASGFRINPAVQDCLRGLGRGTVRILRELVGAIAAAVSRLRKPQPVDTRRATASNH
jgi:hypothetical protein